MIKALIHGARLHRKVLVGQGEPCHLARLDREHGALRIDSRFELRPHLLQHDAETRRMNDALAFAHEFAEPPIRSVGNDEIGVEEQQERLRHVRTQVDEAAEQCSCQNDAVFARLARHQIVERGELDLANLGEPLE